LPSQIELGHSAESIKNNDQIPDNVEDNEVSELLQFQVHHWHPVTQATHLENTENHSLKGETIVKKSLIFEN
jgi:hypothetical protein